MTCIVGIEHDGQVIIGGDSAAVSGLSKTIRADEKVFTVGPFVMGFTTSFRMGQLLRYTLDASAPDGGDIDRYMATTFVDAVRTTLKAGGWARADNGQEEGGSFLIGIHGRLYAIHSDYQFERSVDGYLAVGSGSNLALGSLHTTAALGSSPAERIHLALNAAAAFNAGVAPPFTLRQAMRPPFTLRPNGS